MRIPSWLIIVIQIQLIARPSHSYTGHTHIRIRWHIRNMMQGLVYDGLRKAESVNQFMRYYVISDQWYTGKLTAIIRAKAARMWRLLERGTKEMETLSINDHVNILDEMTGLGIEVDKLTEVMENYMALGMRKGIKEAEKAARNASKKNHRRHLEQIIRQNDPGHILPGDVRGLNKGEMEVLRMLQSFQLKRAYSKVAASGRHSPLDNGGFNSAEYRDFE